MSSTPPESLPTRPSFNRRVDEAKPSKTDINFVIMDYLINEGYPAAAKKFAVEANLQHASDDVEIEERVDIRNAILAGDIQTAIEKINDLTPDLLDLDPSLHFALLRLQLLEIIRECTSDPNNDITPAIVFATTHLAPRAPTNPEFLSDLERTMALLIFPHDNLTGSLAGMLDPEVRQRMATKVNEAILSSQGSESQAKLRSLVRLRAWAERKAREQNNDLPSRLDIWGDSEPRDDDDTVMSGEDIMVI